MKENKRVFIAAEDALKNGNYVLHACSVIKKHDGGGEGSRILVLTDHYISYYKDGWGVSQDRTFPWYKLTRCDFTHDSICLFFQDEKMRFTTTDAEEIRNKIFNLLQRTLNKAEFELLSFSHSPCKAFFPNAVGLLIRFDSLLSQSGDKMDVNVKKVIQQAIMCQNNELDISDPRISMNDLCCILETFLPVNFVKTLKIQLNCPESTCATLSDFFQSHISSITQLWLDCPLDSNFQILCISLKNTENCSIDSLSLANAELTDEHISYLTDLFSARPIRAFGLPKSLTNESLLSDFFSSDVCTSLRVLQLDNTQYLNIEELLSSNSKVEILSLSFCNLELSEVFSAVLRSKWPLVGLNLAGNSCTSFNGRSVPSQIRILDVSKVVFSDSTIASFLDSVFKNPASANMVLMANDLSFEGESDMKSELDQNYYSNKNNGLNSNRYINSNGKENESNKNKKKKAKKLFGKKFEEALKRFDGAKLSFKGFYFDNEIESKLLEKIISQIDVINLSVKGCKIPKVSPNSLQYLSADCSMDLLKNLQNCSHLKRLDLRGGRMGPSITPLIITLIKETDLEELRIDGNELYTTDYEAIISAAEERGTDFVLEDPTEDFSMNNEDMKKIQNLRTRLWRLKEKVQTKNVGGNESSEGQKSDNDLSKGENKRENDDTLDQSKKGYSHQFLAPYDSPEFPLNAVLERVVMSEDKFPSNFEEATKWLSLVYPNSNYSVQPGKDIFNIKSSGGKLSFPPKSDPLPFIANDELANSLFDPSNDLDRFLSPFESSDSEALLWESESETNEDGTKAKRGVPFLDFRFLRGPRVLGPRVKWADLPDKVSGVVPAYDPAAVAAKYDSEKKQSSKEKKKDDKSGDGQKVPEINRSKSEKPKKEQSKPTKSESSSEEEDYEVEYKPPKWRFPIGTYDAIPSRELSAVLDHRYRLDRIKRHLDREDQ